MTRFILKKKSTGLYYRNKGLNGRWIDDISNSQSWYTVSTQEFDSEQFKVLKLDESK